MLKLPKKKKRIKIFELVTFPFQQLRITKALTRLHKRQVPILFFEIARIETNVMLKHRHPCFCLAARLYL